MIGIKNIFYKKWLVILIIIALIVVIAQYKFAQAYPSRGGGQAHIKLFSTDVPDNSCSQCHDVMIPPTITVTRIK